LPLPGHLIDSAVAADCHDDFRALPDSLVSKLGCMSFALRPANGTVKAMTVQKLRNEVDDLALVRRTRNGVYNEYYLCLFIHLQYCKDINKLRYGRKETRKIKIKGKNMEQGT